MGLFYFRCGITIVISFVGNERIIGGNEKVSLWTEKLIAFIVIIICGYYYSHYYIIATIIV